MTRRAPSPLAKAADAIEVDTSAMSIDEVLQELERIVTARWARRLDWCVLARSGDSLFYTFCRTSSCWSWACPIGCESVGPTTCPGGTLILAVTHKSETDPLFAGVAMGRPLAYMAKIELFRIWGLRQVVTALGAFPSTGVPATVPRWRRRCVCWRKVAPCSCSRGHTSSRRRGASVSARRGMLPSQRRAVVPVAVKGTDHLAPLRMGRRRYVWPWTAGRPAGSGGRKSSLCGRCRADPLAVKELYDRLD